MKNPLPSSAPVVDPADLAVLMRLVGFAPTDTNGIRLRGCPNPDGTLRWIWPVTLRQPLFLEFFNASSFKARFFSVLVKLVFTCRLQALFFRLLPGRFAPTGEQVWPRAEFAMFTGTPGPNRKAVCSYVLASGQLVFAKLPLGPVAAEMMRAETAQLQALGRHKLTDVDVPRVLDAGPTHLLQSGVKQPGAYRTTHFGPAHTRCLAELLAATSVRQPIMASNCWQHIEEQVTELQDLAETRVPFGLRTKLRHLLLTIDSTQELSFAFAHGDFTPWNCWLGPERLAVYDLGLALPEASLLYDLFHFEVQQALITTHRSPAEIRARALATATENFAAVPTAELAVAWQLYLLHQITTGALLYHAQTTWHPQVTWLLNGWNALLTLELASVLEHRQLALYDLHDYVQLLPQPGVVLKPHERNAYYPAPTSDLDLLLKYDDVRAGVRFLQGLPLVQSAVVRLAGHMQSVDCLFKDGTLLTVDLLHQLDRQELHLLDADAVLAQARPTIADVREPTLTHDFVYTWLFCWLNQNNLLLGNLRFFQQQPTARQLGLLTYLTTTYGLDFHSIAEASVYHEARAAHLNYVLR